MKRSAAVFGLFIGSLVSAQRAPGSAAAAPPEDLPAAAPQPAPATAPALVTAPAVDLNARPATAVKLVTPGDHRIVVELPDSKIIEGDAVNLVPGEEFLIEVERVKNRLVHPRRVEKIAHPERTLKLRFEQDKDSPGMLFIISNPFKQSLKYRSEIMPAGRTVFEETSNVGIPADLQSFEMWPFPVARIRLSGFTLLEADGDGYTPGR